MKTVLSLFIILLMVACNSSDQKQDYTPKEYKVYIQGNLAGTHASTLDADGNYIYTYEYNDRGRGPEIEEKIKLNEDGFITSLEISGVNYLKDTISEVFSFGDGKAQWKSTSEKGEKASNGSAFYASTNGTLGDTELLIRRLLASPNHSVELLPNGTAKIISIQEAEVGGNTLRLLEITGFGFVPSYVWIDTDDRVFASISSWITKIEEENVAHIEKLLAIQTEKENSFFKTLAKELTEKPTGPVIIKNVNLFDSNTGETLPNHHVLINGNTIEAISTDENSLPTEATIIDGTNKMLLPGLFDNHCHVQREDGILHLAAGVTSIRDMANSMELIEMKKEFDENSSIGPRVVTMAGFIDQKGPFAGPGLTITNIEEGLEAIQNFKDKGYHQIKLYSSIDPSWVKPLAQKAHDLGLKLSGHIPAHMLAEDAIKDGFDEIQHVNMLALNFLSDTIDTRTPLRFSAVAEHTHNLDLKGDEFKAFVQLLKDKDIEIDPTVSIFEGMFITKAGEPDPQFETILDRLPIQVSRNYYSGGLPIPEGKEQQYKDSFSKLLDIVYELHMNGITILPGTDATPGFALHKELENYVRAGIPAADVLKLATLTSARVTHTDDRLGSIEKGKLADLILVDGNPAENISDIRRVELTIKNGNIYRPEHLYQSLGVKHFK
ncbi:amidohydrolase family protein [Flagellimonas sp.]|uniref:amidohydrolase family protein n=1 Tax=Flagellimonas sp. TaxID=2058762 RepID=UPI003B5CC07B